MFFGSLLHKGNFNNDLFGCSLLIRYLCRKVIVLSKRKYVRQIVAFGDYFKDFKKTLPKTALNKIYQEFLYIMTLQVIPKTLLKRVEGVLGLLEFA